MVGAIAFAGLVKWALSPSICPNCGSKRTEPNTFNNKGEMICADCCHKF